MKNMVCLCINLVLGKRWYFLDSSDLFWYRFAFISIILLCLVEIFILTRIPIYNLSVLIGVIIYFTFINWSNKKKKLTRWRI